MFTLLRVDMADKSCTFEEIPAFYACMGGRGLISSIFAREAPPECDPRSPHNKLIFSPGLLGGTLPFFKNRLAIGCKSPVTGGLKSAACGCLAATHLLRLGILGIIIENTAPQDVWLQLEVRRRHARLVPSPVAGLGINAAMATLRGLHGSSCSCICIGPAGESSLPAANIAFTDPEGLSVRHAGQGGMGAVMGAKRLKSVVVFPPDVEESPVAEAGAFTEAAGRFAAALAELSAKTRQASTHKEEKPVPEAAEPSHGFKGKGLAGNHCLNGCGLCGRPSAVRHRKDKKRSAAYSALWNVTKDGAADTSLHARFDSLCDDLGLDAFAVSAAVAACMEAGMMRKGDGEAIIAAVKQIGAGRPLGGMPGGDPDTIRPAVTEQETTRSQTAERQKASSDNARRRMAFADTIGLCVFAARAVLDSPKARRALVQLLSARYGWELPVDYARSLGERIIAIEDACDSRIFESVENSGTAS